MRRELRAAPEALFALFLHMTDGVVLIDRRRHLSDINPAAEALTGWRQRDLDLLTCSVFGCRDEHGRPLCAEQCMALRAIESGDVMPMRAMVINNAETQPVGVEATIIPVRAPDGRYSSAAMVLRDLAPVTGYLDALRLVNEDLADRNVALRSLQAGLSSAWKLPLVTVQSATLTLQGHYAANLGATGMRHVKRILEAAHELEGLFARLQAQARTSANPQRRRKAEPEDEKTGE